MTVDHPDHVAPLGQAAEAAGVRIGVLVDVDLGMKRTGVQTIEAAVDLARKVAATAALRFDGLMGYEGHTLMIPDPVEKRSAIEGAIGRLLEAGMRSKPLVSRAGSSPRAGRVHIRSRPVFPDSPKSKLAAAFLRVDTTRRVVTSRVICLP